MLHIEETFKPSVKLVSFIDNAPKLIASSAKLTISPKDFNEILGSIGLEKTRMWIEELIKRGHGSPLEHSFYAFEVTCSRVASHQLVRHRIASYTQLSQRCSDKFLNEMFAEICRITSYGCSTNDYATRVVLIKNLLSSTTMGFDELLTVVSKSFIIPPRVFKKRDGGFIASILRSVVNYYEALMKGFSYEDARYLLPQCVKTKLLVSMNARELMEVFLPLRMCSRAQWEIRFIAWSVRNQLVKAHPEVFAYAGPRCVLLENRVRDRPEALESYINGEAAFTINRCPELVPRDSINTCLKKASLDPWDINGENLFTQ